MDIIDAIRKKAASDPKRIVLPESDDERTLDAAAKILDKGIAKPVIVGREDVARRIKAKNKSDLEIIDPNKYSGIEGLTSEYYELRKHKGMTPDEAREVMRKDYVTFGAMLVRNGAADGFVAGANHTTPDVIRTALRCLVIDPAISVVAGAFLMVVPHSSYGEEGIFIFADCGVNPEPNSRQLAGIAVSAAALFRQLVGKAPHVAFLSYSTKGSAKGPLVEKVVDAIRQAKDADPGLLVDGELQADSAIVPEVARIKCPDSEVAGRANVLVFPNLESGNISYKLVQRLAGARAVGPILLGFTKPASDLSRGCSAEDIIDAVAITAARVK